MRDCPDLHALESSSIPETLLAHVASCASCRIVRELLGQRRDAAKAQDIENECIRFELLLAQRDEGTIGTAAAALLDEHLRKCAECTAVANTMLPRDDMRPAMLPQVAPSAYALGREVARGGMGRILVAEDLRIGRRVAVKELLGKSPSLAARFEREARVTARLQHPGIVPIYEIGTWPDGTPFYAMRMVEGNTLRQVLADKKTLDARLTLLSAVIAAADAIAFAHDKQIIHRDITPNNVLVGAYGDTVVIDWGLAKDLSSADSDTEDEGVGPYRDEARTASLTHAGAVIGTAAYMPPEQAIGKAVDERADVYALGALLYHVLAGRPPYAGQATGDVLEAVRRGPPKALELVAPHAPRDLVSIVGKAMARSPDDRYANAAGLAEELRRFQSGLVVEAHAYSVPERTRRWMRRHRALMVAIAATALSASIAGTIGFMGVLRERDNAEVGERRAEEQRLVAEHSANALLIELGRQELLAGHPGRAAALLSAAYSNGDRSVSLRFLLRSAMLNFDGIEHTLVGAPDGAPKAIFSPDGSRLLVIRQAVVEQWRVADGVLEFRYPVLNFEQGKLAYSADGTRLVTAYPKGKTYEPLKVWDTKTGRMIRTVDAGDVAYAGLSPDGAQAIALGRDGELRVWDLERGVIVRSVRVHSGDASVARLTDDGLHLLVVERPTHLVIWDWQRGTRVSRLDHGAPLPPWVDWYHAPDASHVVTCGGGESTKVWNGLTGIVTARIAPSSPAHVIFCRYIDTTAVVMTADDGYVVIANPNDGHVRATLKVSDGPVFALPMADHTRLITMTLGVGDRHTIRDVNTGTVLATFEGKEMTAPPSGDRVAVTQLDGSVRVINPSVGRLRNRFVRHDHAIDLAYQAILSPDLRRMITFRAMEPTLWDLATGTKVRTPTLLAPVCFSGDGLKLAARGENDTTVIIEVSTGQVETSLTTTKNATDFALDDHGSRLVVVSPDQPTQVWDVGRTELVKTVPGLAAKEPQAFLDRAGRHLLTWQWSGDAQLQDLEGDSTPRILTHSMRFPLPSLSRDGKRVALFDDSSGSSGVKIFDSANGEKLLEREAIWASFDSTYQRMVISDFGEMRVGSTNKPASMASFPAGASPRDIAVALTPDGSLLLSTGGVWNASDGRALAKFVPPSERQDVDGDHGSYGLGAVVMALDGRSGATYANKDDISVWDLSLEDRTPEEIAKRVAMYVPWRVVNGELVAVPTPVAKLHGRVTRAGKPVEAEVRILDTNHVVLSSKTGEYAFDSLSVGTGKVWSVTSDRTAFTRPHSVVLKNGDNIFDLELDLAASIEGQLVDHQGHGVGGVPLHAECGACSVPDAGVDSDGGDDVTDADGRFSIGGLSGGGTYTFSTGAGFTSKLLAPIPTVVKNGDDHVTGVRLQFAP
jgi:eukaryotic-like serine/threonine-protein kinase